MARASLFFGDGHLSLQAQAIGSASGSTSLPADIARRAALLLNPNVQLSPLAQNLLVREDAQSGDVKYGGLIRAILQLH